MIWCNTGSQHQAVFSAIIPLSKGVVQKCLHMWYTVLNDNGNGKYDNNGNQKYDSNQEYRLVSR